MNDTSAETKPTTGISRRALNKGLAWGVPVVALAAAAPAVAASTPTGPRRFTAWVETTSQSKVSLDFELPADASNITFSVRGGGGGGTSGGLAAPGPGQSGVTYGAGGSAHVVTGALATATAARPIALVAGAGGGAAGTNNSSAGGEGFGNGGSHNAFGTSGFTGYLARGGGGGGGSALRVGGVTQIVAGGGGGAGGYPLVFADSVTSEIFSTVNGGNAEAHGEAPSHKFSIAGVAKLTVNANSGTDGRGNAAAGATGGSGSSVPGASEPDLLFWSKWGASGGGGNLATGGNGGNGGAEGSNVGNGITDRGSVRIIGQAGGGGGGWAGGGGGGTRMYLDKLPDASTSSEWGACASGGGGGGSSYTGGGAVDSFSKALANNGGPAGEPGRSGRVEVSFTSSTFTDIRPGRIEVAP